MKSCPFFGKCGGCGLDCAASDYRARKVELLDGVHTDEIVWIADRRRRADFAFLDGKIGFFAPRSNDVVEIDACLLLSDDINSILNDMKKLPRCGRGSVLITKCDNGLAADFNSAASIYPPEIKNLSAARVTWNGGIVQRRDNPFVFGRTFPPNCFLQPTIESENFLIDFVREYCRMPMDTDKKVKIVDLFCGLGTLSAGLNADGFDSFDSGYGVVRDLIKRPLTSREFGKYDAIILDPPRAGAAKQCENIAKSAVKCVIYISCNPATWLRDRQILEQGGRLACKKIIAIDQFAGSEHWELATVFTAV